MNRSTCRIYWDAKGCIPARAAERAMFAEVRVRPRLIDDGRVDSDKTDEVDRSLTDLEVRLSGVADVHRETLDSGIVMVDVMPRNPDALPMSWIFMGNEIVFQAGRHGGRWELARTPEGVDFMERLVSSVVEGRVRETFGPKRSQVQVTMPDGTTVTETGYVGWLPIPGWKRRGRSVEYEACVS